jgi:hypothetical protein
MLVRRYAAAVCCNSERSNASVCAQVSFALAQAASGASAKRGTKRKADGGAASPEPVGAGLLRDILQLHEIGLNLHRVLH